MLHHHGSREWSDGSDFFKYIYHNLGAYQSDTDDEMEDAVASKCEHRKV